MLEIPVRNEPAATHTNPGIRREQCENEIFTAVVRHCATAISQRMINARQSILERTGPIVNVWSPFVCFSPCKLPLDSLMYGAKRNPKLTALLSRLALTYSRISPVKRGSNTLPQGLCDAIRQTYAICTSDGTSSFVATLSAMGLNHTAAMKEKLVNQISKICRYWEVCLYLTSFTKYLPSNMVTIISLETLDAYEHNCARICTPGHSKCWVHAEVQLIFYYATHASLNRHLPRVLGTSKAACYLCNLFIRHHGKFFVSKTHGHLYDQWTIPDLASVGAAQQAIFRAVLKNMNEDIKKDIVTNRKRLTNRPHPANSFTSFLQRCPPRPSPASSTVLTEQRNSTPRTTDVSALTRQKPSKRGSPLASAQTIRPVEAPDAESNHMIDPENGKTSPFIEADRSNDAVFSTTLPTGHSSVPRDNIRPLIPDISSKQSPCQSDLDHTDHKMTSAIAEDSTLSSTQTLRPMAAPELDSASTVDTTLDARSLRNSSLDIDTAMSFQQLVTSSLPLHTEFHSLALEVECEAPIRGNVTVFRSRRNPTDDSTTMKQVVELASLKIDEDMSFEVNDPSRTLLLEFCKGNQYILGVDLQWL